MKLTVLQITLSVFSLIIEKKVPASMIRSHIDQFMYHQYIPFRMMSIATMRILTWLMTFSIPRWQISNQPSLQVRTWVWFSLHRHQQTRSLIFFFFAVPLMTWLRELLSNVHNRLSNNAATLQCRSTLGICWLNSKSKQSSNKFFSLLTIHS